MSSHSGGGTLEDHLRKAASLGSQQARLELEGPDLPRECVYVWTWFLELHAARSVTATGPQPLSYAEIDAWARLTRRRPTPAEISWLKWLDRVWLSPPDPDEGQE